MLTLGSIWTPHQTCMRLTLWNPWWKK